MSKTYSNQDKVERVKEPLFQVNRLKFRGVRSSEPENLETNLLKLDLTRIENELDSIDTQILDDLNYIVGDIEDLTTSVLLDDGLSYEISGVKSFAVDTAPSIFADAVLWLDPSDSVVGETTIKNKGWGGSALDATYNASPVLLPHAGENYFYNSGVSGNYAAVPPTPEMNLLGIEGAVGTRFAHFAGYTAGTRAQSIVTPSVLVGSGVVQFEVCAFVPGTNAELIGTSNSKLFAMYINAGILSIGLTVGGTNRFMNVGACTTGSVMWYRASFDPATGVAVGYQSVDGVNWIQTGTQTVTAGALGIFGGYLYVGYAGFGVWGECSIYRAKVVTEGVTTFDADFSIQPIGATSFIENTGKTVSFVGDSVKIVDGTTYLYNSGIANSFTFIADQEPIANHLDILGVPGTSSLSLPGVNGNYGSTPSVSALDITGDVELVVRVIADRWASGTTQSLLDKTGSFGGYGLRLSSTGYLLFTYGDGTAWVTPPQSSIAVPFTNGLGYWIKVTFDVDNGASGNTTRFYYASNQATEPTSWTQLGTDIVTAGVATFGLSPQPLSIGAISAGGGQSFTGLFYNAVVRNGIAGTTIFNARFDIQAIGSTSFTESTGKVVTVNGSAAKIVDNTTYLYNDATTVSTTATQATIGATTIVVASATGLAIGQMVTAAGFLTYGTLVTGVSGTTITIDRPTLAAMSATPVTFIHNNYVSIPDNAAFNFTGDLEIVCRIAARNWTSSASQIILGKGYGQQYYMYLTNTAIGVGITIAGPTNIFPSISWSTGRPTIGGTAVWIKYTRNATTGANTFYYCADQNTEPTSGQWNLIGVATEATAGNMLTSSQPFSIGAGNNGAVSIYSPFAGRILNTIVRDGIDGTKVVDVDFTRQIQFATSFVESSANAMTATLVGTGVRIERERNIDISVRVQFNTFSVAQSFISKDGAGNTVGGYHFGISSTGNIYLSISDGTTIYQYNVSSGFSASDIGLILGKKYWLRVTMDVLDPTVGSVVKFYFAEDKSFEPTSWTQIGSDITGVGNLSIAPNTRNVAIGSYTSGSTNGFNGKIFYAIVKNGINGTPVIKADFTKQIQFSTWFADSSQYANTVTSMTLNTSVCFNGSRIERKRNLELVCRVAADDWTPAAESYICGRYNTASTGPYREQRTFALSMSTAGRPTIRIGQDGGQSPIAISSSVVPSFVNKTTYWIKVTVDTDNGLGGSTCRFYYANDQIDEPTSWLDVGGPVITANATSFSPSESFFEFGSIVGVRSSLNTSTGPFAGKIFRVIARNGIGGNTVLDKDFTKEIVSGSQNYLSLDSSVKSNLDTPLYIENLGTSGSILNIRPGATFGPDNTAAITTTATLTTDPKWLSHTGENYLYISGASGNYASSADNAAFDILGDIDISCRVALDDWTPLHGLTNDLVVRDNGDGNRAFRFYLDELGRPCFAHYPSASAASQILRVCNAVPGFENRKTYWLRVTMDVDNGSGSNVVVFYWTPDQSPEPSVWYQLGSQITLAGVTSIPNVTSGITIGGTIGYAAGKFFRTIVRNGISGSKVLDIDFTTAISAVNQTTLTDSTGKTVAISRNSTGRKCVAVYRPCWMFGSGTYMEVLDNGILDMNVNDSFSVVSVIRQWGTPATATRFYSKGAGAVAGTWVLQCSNTFVPTFRLDSTSTNAAATVGAMTSGTLHTVTGIRNTSADTIVLYRDTTPGTVVNDTTTISVGNSSPLRIGADGNPTTNNGDFELFATALFRRALTAAEVTLINNHYNGTITAASQALLNSAEFYLDAAKATQTGAIVKSSTNRKATSVTRPGILLGTDDYLSIADNSLLDFSSTESFSAMISFRIWNTPPAWGRLFSKSDNFTTSGYELYVNNQDDVIAFGLKGDTGSTAYLETIGAFGDNLKPGKPTFGQLINLLIIRDVAQDKIYSYADGELSDSAADTTAGTMANSYPFTINAAAYSPSGSGVNMEFYGLAVWRKALKSSEVAEISNYYNLKSTILKVDTLNKLSAKLARLDKVVRRLESGV